MKNTSSTLSLPFKEKSANDAYAALVSGGSSEQDAFMEVELQRLNGFHTPIESRSSSRVFAITGSSDQKRAARNRGLREMAENDPDKFDQYKRQAAAAGVDISGKTYNSGLAAYPGDPDGWVRDDNDIKSIAKMKGIHVTKEDGELKLEIPIPAGESPAVNMLKRKRLFKPVRKKRVPQIKGLDKAGSFR